MRQKPQLATILRKNIHQRLSHTIGLEKARRPAVVELTKNLQVD
jgi:hypothetical protein